MRIQNKYGNVLFFLYSLFPLVSSNADYPPGDDKIGIYTEPDGTGYNNLDAEVGEHSIYLLLTGCSSPSGISGWECNFIHPVGHFLLAFQIEGLGTDIGIENEHIVELTQPFPQAAVILLATLTYFITSESLTGIIWLDTVDNPIIPEHISYRQGDNYGIAHIMIPSSGELNCLIFGFNSGPLPDCDDPPDAVSCATWGGVLTLYR